MSLIRSLDHLQPISIIEISKMEEKIEMVSNVFLYFRDLYYRDGLEMLLSEFRGSVFNVLN